MNVLRALIIDGADDDRQKLTTLLEQAGFVVSYAANGQEGLQKAKEQHFQLVCCSYQLPDFAGGDLCGQLRALPGYDFTSVIMLAAEKGSRMIKQAMLAGATDIFSKHNLGELTDYLHRFTARVNRKLTGRVLLVEDSRVIQEVIIDLLTDMGLDVDAYIHGEGVCEALIAGHYDLVITDIMLEGTMTGLSLIRQIRQLPENKGGNVPVIALSGFDNLSRKIELFHLGVNDYIAKPIVREEFKQRVYNHVSAYQSILALKTQQSALYSLALLDELTQLFNRHALREFSKKYFSLSRRCHQPLTMAVLDIDYFSRINAQRGARAGNKLLAELGFLLKRSIRPEDIVARWSGDEFVMLLSDCDLDRAQQQMQQLQKQLQQIRHGNETITLSIGLAAMSAEAPTLNSLFERADSAMYQAKLAGRNTIRIYQECSDEST